jgi:hypothetical protein
METPMTRLTRTAGHALAAVLAALSMAATAEAGGRGKDYFVQDYQFKQPMNGFSGHQGNYYCDFVKLPNRKCDANGNNCKIVSWTLRQTCS